MKKIINNIEYKIKKDKSKRDMETLDKLFTEKQVEELGEKVLADVREKVKEQIGDAVYSHLGSFLYEHYTNMRDKIKEELIKEITEQYVKNPKDYNYKDLRRKIWEENKDEIVKTLTNEAIKDSVENVIMEYTHRDYHFSWQWKDHIVKIILQNWDKFKDDERIKEAFGRELDNRQSYINSLEQQLQEIKDIAE